MPQKVLCLCSNYLKLSEWHFFFIYLALMGILRRYWTAKRYVELGRSERMGLVVTDE
jgi:hypothetical protein